MDKFHGTALALELDALRPASRAAVVSGRDRYDRGLRELIEEAVREGLFRPTDPKLTAFAIVGAINWIGRWYRPGRGRLAGGAGRALREPVPLGASRRAGDWPKPLAPGLDDVERGDHEGRARIALCRGDDLVAALRRNARRKAKREGSLVGRSGPDRPALPGGSPAAPKRQPPGPRLVGQERSVSGRGRAVRRPAGECGVARPRSRGLRKGR